MTELVEVSWTLVAYAKSTWAARYSRRHLMYEGSDRTLCGITPPWGSTTFGSNHSGYCQRCQGRR